MIQQEIKRLFNERLKKASTTSFLAEVKEVQSEDRTCTVEFEEVEYEDVLLYSVVDSEKKGFVFLPKVGSKVMVTRIAGSNNLFVSMFSEVDKMFLSIGEKMSVEVTDKEAKINSDEIAFEVTDKGLKTLAGDTKFEVSSEGIKIAKTNNLKAVLEELIDAISAITVIPTAFGTPSKVPDNVAQIIEIKKKLEFLV